MPNILHELWYGELCSDRAFEGKSDREESELVRLIESNREKLNKKLTEEQLAVFEAYDDCINELADINDRRIFSYGFRLGANMMMEVLRPS